MSRFPEDPQQQQEARRAPGAAGDPRSQPPGQRPDTVGPRGNQDVDEQDVARGADKLERVSTH